MMRAWRTTVVAVLLSASTVGAAASCSLVGEPDAAAWDSQAEQALTDAASEVATARLALRTAARERVWSSYAVVLVAQAEEAATKVEDDLSRVQPPAEREERAQEVGALVEDAVAAVRRARSLAVEGRYDDAATLADLEDLTGSLERAAGVE